MQPPCSRKVCSTCGRQFTSRTQLFKHLRIHSHGQNWTQTALLAELQTLLEFLKKRQYDQSLHYARWCLQKIVNAVSALRPQEAREIARSRAHNGATILHFLLNIWCAWPKKPLPPISVFQLLKQLASWAIRSSEISPPPQEKSVTEWSGLWFTKHSGFQRGSYCGYQSAQRARQQAALTKPLAEFCISGDKCWPHHSCRPGESALQVCVGLGFRVRVRV